MDYMILSEAGVLFRDHAAAYLSRCEDRNELSWPQKRKVQSQFKRLIKVEEQ